MGNCDDLSSSPNRAGYVSWSMDSGESWRPSTGPAPGTGEKEAFSNQSQEPTSSVRVASLVRSTQEPSGEETNTVFDLPYPRKQLTRRKCTKISKNSRQIPENSKLRDHDRNSKLLQDAMANKEEPSHCKDEKVPLHRSSPVISRRSKPISWQKKAASPSNSLSSCDQHECVTSTGKEDVEPRLTSCHQSFETMVEDKKPRVPLSSSSISILQSQDRSSRSPQRSEKEHRGWSLNSWSTPKRTGHSSSTSHNKDRSCSELLDLPPDIFKASCELEKENAHFVVVDMTLEVLEGVKWTLSFDSMTYKHCTACATGQPGYEGREPARAHGSDGSSGWNRRILRCDARTDWGAEPQEPQAGHSEHQTKSPSILSTDSGFEDCGVGTMPPDLVRNSAECLAQQLVLEFKRKWLPSHVHRRGRQSLRSSLQELPGTGGVEVKTRSLTEEIRLRTRMRGSLNWAPPSFQIIFSVQPPHRRSEVVASQHYLCAGCGTEVEPRYIKKLRHCEYLGRYFCDCCHSGSEAIIPGRVLSNWDFSRYSVSDFSKQLLDSVWSQPLFDLSSVGKALWSKVKDLDRFRELREQLVGIRKLLRACRLSERALAEFDPLPAHLLDEPLLFSMEDLYRAKKGQLVAQARALLNSALEHVDNCELCRGRGFICEFCRAKDIIFPFQKDKCQRCPVCKACFHKDCFLGKRCPKCTRIQSRTKVQMKS
ncbi:protein associated with UVRAG as autophagy enhancer isoform X1 [Poeciliopsis prolifica]|uniref:protein associated with UVRAG as autophagy enhancer isoform X1 n=1 Tax=Poeciliopsis prolifica TaxID=188132 RepID=UPI002413F7BD|nr:protein associated with UVRAG as autophagy enhancer isoform X1 [Poeciliopsis prolifica]